MLRAGVLGSSRHCSDGAELGHIVLFADDLAPASRRILVHVVRFLLVVGGRAALYARRGAARALVRRPRGLGVVGYSSEVIVQEV